MREEDYADLFDRPIIKEAIAKSCSRSVGILWLVQRGRCFWCDRTCMKPCKRTRRQYSNKTLPIDFFTLDHVQSRWQGGGNGADNLVGACYRCNNFRNSTEHNREVGRTVAANQPEEVRLKRFIHTPAVTIPFEKGLSRRQANSIRALSA